MACLWLEPGRAPGLYVTTLSCIIKRRLWWRHAFQYFNFRDFQIFLRFFHPSAWWPARHPTGHHSGSADVTLWRWSQSCKAFILVTFFKKWAIPGLFFVYFWSYSNKHQYNFTRNEREIMSIQYTAFGFEPTTFRTWVSSHNHQTKLIYPSNLH